MAEGCLDTISPSTAEHKLGRIGGGVDQVAKPKAVSAQQVIALVEPVLSEQGLIGGVQVGS